jgi:DNA gyrase subunit A
MRLADDETLQTIERVDASLDEDIESEALPSAVTAGEGAGEVASPES